ncbi:pyrimidine operon attenuation protein / uracil phosphoribosyltransferase [Peptoniphilus asaccharolyticus DSM 20463]|uniref:Bifunctional protein PyrR n=1 Tax=Peptoniphilus asaccharolyticus DSM 20463 TaxID=573058 RepID=A0A1W1UR24_PEPAS|nr:bifunctional pyr operon transcriptional regulator/uracil phosphoribosyltransferase PyrR [Peptoniphilus asaccharolyticus]MBL7575047.1 bifunctional pyr operon transcriptional regulator/uracil phosphoribosyltransferase PyrR [Peptoniphilus asaccharolyticus]MBL7575072.1 bifunctional pyr operon transcriptional regulator/uracil phosphoribosyltransferase PyrR [Peptoniphilus asaccharolyticus]SMB83520.1 pyrimidine operon attenuation protein / uracil phosphoribosyltransferase [Peptoniphilus asaccharolyt
MKNIIMDEIAIKRAISRISNEILEKSKGPEDLILLGIVSRGEDIADRISSKILEIESIKVPVYAINPINFRDDRENSRELDLNIDMNGKTVILVDDVIYTGRTVRAALDAILSIGRPKAIRLVSLVDRGHRELPIRPDFVGKNLPTAKREKVVVELSEVDGQDKVYIES